MRVRFALALVLGAVSTAGLWACEGGSDLNPQPLPPISPQDNGGAKSPADNAGDGTPTASPSAAPDGGPDRDGAAEAGDAGADG